MDKLNLHNISGGGSKVVSDRCRRLIPIQWLHAWSWTLHHQQHYAIKRHTMAALFSKLDIFNNAHSWHFGNQCAMLPLQNTKLKQQCKKKNPQQTQKWQTKRTDPTCKWLWQAGRGEWRITPKPSVICSMYPQNGATLETKVQMFVWSGVGTNIS